MILLVVFLRIKIQLVGRFCLFEMSVVLRFVYYFLGWRCGRMVGFAEVGVHELPEVLFTDLRSVVDIRMQCCLLN